MFGLAPNCPYDSYLIDCGPIDLTLALVWWAFMLRVAWAFFGAVLFDRPKDDDYD